MNQKEKTKFRASKRWKDFRSFVAKEQQGLDLITQKKLTARYNCHHLDLREENYRRLEPAKFVCLNRTTHKMLHWLYTYYKQDPSILDRLEVFLNFMLTFSGEESPLPLEKFL